MARVTGVVTGVEDGIASVECGAMNHSACSVCATGTGCQWRRAAGRPRRLEVDSRTGPGALTPGDTITIEVEDHRLLQALGWLYLPPLAGLLAGPGLLRAAGLEQGMLPLAAALAGLAAGAAVAQRYTRRGLPVSWEPAAPADRERRPGAA